MADEGKDLVRRLQNFQLLARYVKDVALKGSPRTSKAAAVDRIGALIGHGRINQSMFGRYLNGVQKGEVQPSTYLSFAEFLNKAEPARWGPTVEDALTLIYDWLMYGPDGAPSNAPPDRHRGRPNVASIQAGHSVRVQGLTQDIPEMTLPEILEAMESLVVALRVRIDDLDECPVLAPEPPCNDDNPLASLIYVSLQRSRPTSSGERQEAVEDLAQRSGLAPQRCRDILCGDTPSPDEVDALALVVGMKPEHLSLVIGRFRAASLPAQNGKAVA